MVQPLLLPRSNHTSVIFVEKPYCLFPQNIHSFLFFTLAEEQRSRRTASTAATDRISRLTSGGKVLKLTTTSNRRSVDRHQDNRQQGNRQLDQLVPPLWRAPLGERRRTSRIRIRPVSAIRREEARTLRAGTTASRTAVTAVTAATTHPHPSSW